MTRVRSENGGVIILYDDSISGKDPVTREWFHLKFWQQLGNIETTPAGRGAAWFVQSALGKFLLRHYRRGGLFRLVNRDRYLWVGENRTRPVREWRILEKLHAEGLPVPRPFAACVTRGPLFTYRGKIIVSRLKGVPLSGMLDDDIDFKQWQDIGRVIARLHSQLVWHADLNAHNILVDESGVSLVDFDRAREMPAAGKWRDENFKRLRRSLEKILEIPLHESPHLLGWQAMLDAYQIELGDYSSSR